MENNLNDKQIQILEVAEKLFAEKGFDGTSIRDISKIANINVAMISYYFGSKDLLLESLIKHKTIGLKEQLLVLIAENLEPVAKINKLIELYINRINCNRGIYRIMHFELTSKKNESILKYFTELKKANLKSVELIIKEGQAKGIFRKDIIIPLITPTIIGTFFHFQMNKDFYEEILDLKTDTQYDNFIKTDLTKHIQQTIKALLVYEN
ncbi:TetR/AcrR family transcriptional regulator [Flavobacterium cellulosilyticum]|uniref:TetR/AcrR family transcriptional regulator n=1 Tax=Flavobacterium cellulosilyticum TaxID=2541731 RepID=A0A4R5C6B5_9FLAO|nr:TetR family transcriptional regulator [Flavobacterium cellulosilyticum]TDD95228.1 TetR/AcrR family transcriptional regulator [Flavobacterium cellulosilyticum]